MVRFHSQTGLSAILLGTVLCWGTHAAEPSVLERGWTEFQFQMFDEAEDLFEEAADADVSRQQGLVGQAMTLQFREKSPKPEAAIEIYQTLLAEKPSANLAALVEALLAEALWVTGQESEADEHWDHVIKGNPDLIAAQDALLRRTVAHVGDLMSEQTEEAIAYAEARRAEFSPPTTDRPGLFPALDGMLGTLHFWRGDYAKARDAYIRAVEIGSLNTTSPVVRGNMIVRIARISEKYLDDPETAGLYYRQLVMELPTDVRSYYAIEKAVGYGKLTRAEIEVMELNGLTSERIDQIMTKGKK